MRKFEVMLVKLLTVLSRRLEKEPAFARSVFTEAIAASIAEMAVVAAASDAKLPTVPFNDETEANVCVTVSEEVVADAPVPTR